MSPTMPCLDDLTISNLVGNVLLEPERGQALAHLDECAACYELVAAIAIGSPRAAAPARLAPGALVGRYEVERVVGAGAMGVVYAARDPKLDRSVALKLVAGAGDSERILREAKAMAQLSHRNVVGVFDVGTIDSDVFFAMELVSGRTLREWLATEPRTPREVAAVMLEAGRGLAAAHAAGIVHRDFKPDNVLIARDGRVCVTDFGLARIPEETTAELVGTPVYMAPEVLAGGPADARSDQFSFCVVLYEGLAGARPFTGKTISELRAAMERGAKPIARLPAHLQRILHRGLALDPARRFEGLPLAELASDPAARRRRFAVGFAAVAAIAVAIPFLRRSTDPCPAPSLSPTWDDARRGQLVLALAPRPQPYAPLALAHANAAFDRYADRWVTLRGEACRATYATRDQSEARYDAELACFERRRGELAAVIDLLVDAPDTETVRHARDIVAGLPDLAPCRDGAVLAEQPALPASPAIRTQVIAAQRELATAHAYARSGKYVAAQQLVTHAMVAAKLYPPALGDALYLDGKLAQATTRDGAAAERSLQAAANIAAQLKDDVLAAQVWTQLAYTLAAMSQKPAEADAMTKVARTAAQRAGDRADLVIDWNNVVGILAMQQGKLLPAVQAFRDALKLAEAQAPTRTSDQIGKLAAILDVAGSYAEAHTLAIRAVALEEQELGPDHPDVAFALDALGGIDYDAGRYTDARDDYRRAYRILERLGEPTYNVTEALEGLGNAAHALGALDEARRYGEKVLAIRERDTPNDPHVGDALLNLGYVLADQGRIAEARADYDRGLQIYRAAYGPNHPQVAVALRQRAQLEVGTRDAVTDLEAALQITVATLGPDHPDAGVIHGNLGGAYAGLKDWKRAEQHFRIAVDVQTKTMGEQHPMTALALVGLAQAIYASGDPTRAIPILEHAIAIDEQVHALPEKTAVAQIYLGRALWETNRDKRRGLQLVRAARAAVATAADVMSTQVRAEADQWLVGK